MFAGGGESPVLGDDNGPGKSGDLVDDQEIGAPRCSNEILRVKVDKVEESSDDSVKSARGGLPPTGVGCQSADIFISELGDALFDKVSLLARVRAQRDFREGLVDGHTIFSIWEDFPRRCGFFVHVLRQWCTAPPVLLQQTMDRLLEFAQWPFEIAMKLPSFERRKGGFRTEDVRIATLCWSRCCADIVTHVMRYSCHQWDVAGLYELAITHIRTLFDTSATAIADDVLSSSSGSSNHSTGNNGIQHRKAPSPPFKELESRLASQGMLQWAVAMSELCRASSALISRMLCDDAPVVAWLFVDLSGASVQVAREVLTQLSEQLLASKQSKAARLTRLIIIDAVLERVDFRAMQESMSAGSFKKWESLFSDVVAGKIYKGAEALSKSEELKAAALSLMLTILDRGPKIFNNAGFATFLNKRVVRHLTEPRKASHSLDILLRALKGGQYTRPVIAWDAFERYWPALRVQYGYKHANRNGEESGAVASPFAQVSGARSCLDLAIILSEVFEKPKSKALTALGGESSFSHLGNASTLAADMLVNPFTFEKSRVDAAGDASCTQNDSALSKCTGPLLLDMKAHSALPKHLRACKHILMVAAAGDFSLVTQKCFAPMLRLPADLSKLSSTQANKTVVGMRALWEILQPGYSTFRATAASLHAGSHDRSGKAADGKKPSSKSKANGRYSSSSESDSLQSIYALLNERLPAIVASLDQAFGVSVMGKSSMPLTPTVLWDSARPFSLESFTQDQKYDNSSANVAERGAGKENLNSGEAPAAMTQKSVPVLIDPMGDQTDMAFTWADPDRSACEAFSPANDGLILELLQLRSNHELFDSDGTTAIRARNAADKVELEAAVAKSIALRSTFFRKKIQGAPHCLGVFKESLYLLPVLSCSPLAANVKDLSISNAALVIDKLVPPIGLLLHSDWTLATATSHCLQRIIASAQSNAIRVKLLEKVASAVLAAVGKSPMTRDLLTFLRQLVLLLRLWIRVRTGGKVSESRQLDKAWAEPFLGLAISLTVVPCACVTAHASELVDCVVLLWPNEPGPEALQGLLEETAATKGIGTQLCVLGDDCVCNITMSPQGHEPNLQAKSVALNSAQSDSGGSQHKQRRNSGAGARRRTVNDITEAARLRKRPSRQSTPSSYSGSVLRLSTRGSADSSPATFSNHGLQVADSPAPLSGSMDNDTKSFMVGTRSPFDTLFNAIPSSRARGGSVRDDQFLWYESSTDIHPLNYTSKLTSSASSSALSPAPATSVHLPAAQATGSKEVKSTSPPSASTSLRETRTKATAWRATLVPLAHCIVQEDSLHNLAALTVSNLLTMWLPRLPFFAVTATRAANAQTNNSGAVTPSLGQPGGFQESLLCGIMALAIALAGCTLPLRNVSPHHISLENKEWPGKLESLVEKLVYDIWSKIEELKVETSTPSTNVALSSSRARVKPTSDIAFVIETLEEIVGHSAHPQCIGCFIKLLGNWRADRITKVESESLNRKFSSSQSKDHIKFSNIVFKRSGSTSNASKDIQSGSMQKVSDTSAHESPIKRLQRRRGAVERAASCAMSALLERKTDLPGWEQTLRLCVCMINDTIEVETLQDCEISVALEFCGAVTRCSESLAEEIGAHFMMEDMGRSVQRADVVWQRAERRSLWKILQRFAGFDDVPLFTPSPMHSPSMGGEAFSTASTIPFISASPTAPLLATNSAFQSSSTLANGSLRGLRLVSDKEFETLRSAASHAAIALLRLGPISLGTVAPRPDEMLWSWMYFVEQQQLFEQYSMLTNYLVAHWRVGDADAAGGGTFGPFLERWYVEVQNERAAGQSQRFADALFTALCRAVETWLLSGAERDLVRPLEPPVIAPLAAISLCQIRTHRKSAMRAQAFALLNIIERSPLACKSASSVPSSPREKSGSRDCVCSELEPGSSLEALLQTSHESTLHNAADAISMLLCDRRPELAGPIMSHIFTRLPELSNAGLARGAVASVLPFCRHKSTQVTALDVNIELGTNPSYSFGSNSSANDGAGKPARTQISMPELWSCSQNMYQVCDGTEGLETILLVWQALCVQHSAIVLDFLVSKMVEPSPMRSNAAQASVHQICEFLLTGVIIDVFRASPSTVLQLLCANVMHAVSLDAVAKSLYGTDTDTGLHKSSSYLFAPRPLLTWGHEVLGVNAVVSPPATSDSGDMADEMIHFRQLLNVQSSVMHALNCCVATDHDTGCAMFPILATFALCHCRLDRVLLPHRSSSLMSSGPSALSSIPLPRADPRPLRSPSGNVPFRKCGESPNHRVLVLLLGALQQERLKDARPLSDNPTLPVASTGEESDGSSIAPWLSTVDLMLLMAIPPERFTESQLEQVVQAIAELLFRCGSSNVQLLQFWAQTLLCTVAQVFLPKLEAGTSLLKPLLRCAEVYLYLRPFIRGPIALVESASCEIEEALSVQLELLVLTRVFHRSLVCESPELQSCILRCILQLTRIASLDGMVRSQGLLQHATPSLVSALVAGYGAVASGLAQQLLLSLLTKVPHLDKIKMARPVVQVVLSKLTATIIRAAIEEGVVTECNSSSDGVLILELQVLARYAGFAHHPGYPVSLLTLFVLHLALKPSNSVPPTSQREKHCVKKVRTAQALADTMLEFELKKDLRGFLTAFFDSPGTFGAFSQDVSLLHSIVQEMVGAIGLTHLASLSIEFSLQSKGGLAYGASLDFCSLLLTLFPRVIADMQPILDLCLLGSSDSVTVPWAASRKGFIQAYHRAQQLQLHERQLGSEADEIRTSGQLNLDHTEGLVSLAPSPSLGKWPSSFLISTVEECLDLAAKALSPSALSLSLKAPSMKIQFKVRNLVLKRQPLEEGLHPMDAPGCLEPSRSRSRSALCVSGGVSTFDESKFPSEVYRDNDTAEMPGCSSFMSQCSDPVAAKMAMFPPVNGQMEFLASLLSEHANLRAIESFLAAEPSLDTSWVDFCVSALDYQKKPRLDQGLRICARFVELDAIDTLDIDEEERESVLSAVHSAANAKRPPPRKEFSTRFSLLAFPF